MEISICRSRVLGPRFGSARQESLLLPCKHDYGVELAYADEEVDATPLTS